MKKKSFFSNTIVQVILLAISYFVFMYVGGFLGLQACIPLSRSGNSALSFLANYLCFIGIWIVVLGFWLIVKKFRYMFDIFGPKLKGNNFKTSIIIGLICGLFINLLLAFLAMLNKDISVSFSEFNIGYTLLFIICVGVQSGAEELLGRAWLYTQFRRLFPKYPLVAILGNSFIFSIMHLVNPGFSFMAFFHIIIAGVMFSLIMYYFDSFWACVIAHTGWNFCQSILLGLPNSGIVSEYSIFKLDAASATDSIFYSTSFGIESTIMGIIVILICCILLCYFGKKKRKAEGSTEGVLSIIPFNEGSSKE